MRFNLLWKGWRMMSGFKNHFNLLYSIAIYCSLFILGPWIFQNKIPSGYDAEFVAWAYFALAFYLLPHLALHLRYWYISQRQNIKIENEIIFIPLEDGRHIPLVFSDVRNVQVVETFASKHNHFHFFPWDSYKYWILTLFNGKRIVLTNLQTNVFDLMTGDVTVNKKTSLYPWP